MEIRAAQRTFEGAYVRTALGQFSFSLVILKVRDEPNRRNRITRLLNGSDRFSQRSSIL